MTPQEIAREAAEQIIAYTLQGRCKCGDNRECDASDDTREPDEDINP